MIQISDELEAIFSHCEKFNPVRAKSLLIDATAGTGKTTALTLIHRQLQNKGKKVLPLAFSRRGASRYMALAKSHAPEIVSCMSSNALCVTLDSLAAHILRQYSTKNRWRAGTIDAEIGDYGLAIETMRASVQHINGCLSPDGDEDVAPIPDTESDISDYLELISNIKTSLIFNASPFNRLTEDQDLEPEDSNDIAAALEAIGLPSWAFSLFNDYENRRKSFQFLMLVDYAYDLLSEPTAIKEFCRARSIDVALIDESHDTKPVHYAMIKELIASGVSVVAVGDESQDIFEFRGIKPFNTNQAFVADGAYTLPLTQTYRFGNPLAHEIEKHLSAMGRSIRVIPAKHKTAIGLANTSGTRGMAAATLAQIDHAKSILIPASDVCVIFPSAQDSFATQHALIGAGIPYRCESIQPYHVASEALFFRAIARLAGWGSSEPISTFDVQALEMLVEMPRLKFTKGQILAIWGDLMDMPESGRPPALKDRIYRTDKVDDVLLVIREKLKLPKTEIPFDPSVVEQFINRLGIHAWLTNKTPSAVARAGLKSAVEHYAGQLSRLGAEGYFKLLNDAQWHGAEGTFDSKIVLTSVLQCKGADWPVVVLSAHWKPAARLNKQQQRELYVAISRAKTHLIGLQN